jgi:hypothetical protein
MYVGLFVGLKDVGIGDLPSAKSAQVAGFQSANPTDNSERCSKLTSRLEGVPGSAPCRAVDEAACSDHRADVGPTRRPANEFVTAAAETSCCDTVL